MCTRKDCRQLSRREFVGLSAVAMGAALAACAPQKPAPVQATEVGVSATPAGEEKPTTAPQPVAERVKLRKMAWGSPLEKENIETGVAKFMDQNPDIEVEYIHVPQEYDAKLQTMLAAGDAPDVFKTASNPYADYVHKGALLDITDLIASDPVLGQPDYFIMPWEKGRSTVDGRWYGIGSCAQFICLYCNLDALEKADVEPPSCDGEKAWTWDEFIEVGRQLTIDEGGKHPGESGFDATRVAQWGLYYPTWDWLYAGVVHSNGGTYMDPTTLRYTLDTPEAIEAIQAIADLNVKHQVAPQAAALQELGMNAWQMLASGKVGIIADGNWALQDICKMGFRFSAGVPPKFRVLATIMDSSRTGIYKNTKYRDETWKLYQYLNLDDYQIGLCKVGLWGPNHKSLLTPEGARKWLTEGVHPEGWEPLECEFKVKYGFTPPNVVGKLKAASVLTAGLDPVWIGQRSAADVCATVTAEANKALDEVQAG